MAINKKGKRKIVVNSKTYLWWCFDEYDQTTFDGKQVRIIAEDQPICLEYGLEQKDDKRIIRYVFNKAREIIHIECPKFENDLGIITPSGISELIKWASIKSDENTTRKITHAYNKGFLNELEAAILYSKILDELNIF